MADEKVRTQAERGSHPGRAEVQGPLRNHRGIERGGEVWRLVGMQAVAGVLVSLVAWAISGEALVAWSAGYGALAVVLPAALFARGMARQKRAATAGAAMVGFFGWEMVKIALTVAMLAAAPRLVSQLSWLALLAGMVVTMKTYWIALMVRPGVRKTD